MTLKYRDYYAQVIERMSKNVGRFEQQDGGIWSFEYISLP